MRMSFDELFRKDPDGIISPRLPVHINGVTMRPGVDLGGGVSFGEVDLTPFVGNDLDVEIHDDVHVIRGIYH